MCVCQDPRHASNPVNFATLLQSCSCTKTSSYSLTLSPLYSIIAKLNIRDRFINNVHFLRIQTDVSSTNREFHETTNDHRKIWEYRALINSLRSIIRRAEKFMRSNYTNTVSLGITRCFVKIQKNVYSNKLLNFLFPLILRSSPINNSVILSPPLRKATFVTERLDLSFSRKLIFSCNEP